MTPEQLKASILQYAIQGKLVEQRPEESTSEELFAKIQEEKQKLIAEKKIKKEKPLPKITDDEKPFDIPDSWKWVRVGQCFANKTGLSYKKDALDIQSDKMVRVLRGGNISNLNYVLKPDDILISAEFVKSELYLQRNTIITPAVTSLEHIGKMGRIDSNYSDMVVGGFVLMLIPHYPEDTLSKYLLYAMSSRYFRDCCRNIVNKSGQAFYNLSREKLMQLCVPLPPLGEQKRIVAKIEELLPLVERYAVSYEKLEQFSAKFPEDMRKSILQYAIQGKLVEQRAEEGTGEELYQQIQAEKQRLIQEKKIKKEKPLAEISEDEIPFDIPESWKWCYIGELFLHNTGKAQNSTGSQNGTIRKFITTSNLYWDEFDFTKVKEMPFTDKELERCTVQKGDLLVCEGGDCGRAAVWKYDEEVCIQNHVHRLRPYQPVDIYYFYYLFYFYKNTGKLRGRGVAIQGLSNDAIHRVIVPLPPLAEQKRIVAKIEELLPLCERLK